MRSTAWPALFFILIVIGAFTACSGRQGHPPTVSLTASVTSALLGESVTLTWHSTGAESCTAAGAWEGQKATSGSESISIVSLPASFGLACSGKDGSANDSASIAGGGKPIAVIGAPTTVHALANVRLDGSESVNEVAAINQSFQWKQTSGPAVTLDGWQSPKAQFVAPPVEAPATIGLELTVTDDTGQQNTAFTSINVTPVSAEKANVQIVSATLLREQQGEHSTVALLNGPPTVGASLVLRVAMTGALHEATFRLVNGDQTLATVPMQLAGAYSTTPATYFGTVTIPSTPFRVLVTGTRGDGQAFSVLSDSHFTPALMGLRVRPSRLLVLPGQTRTAHVTVTNAGPAATYSISASDPGGLLSASPPTTLLIQEQSSTSFEVSVLYPTDSELLGPQVVTIVAQVADDPARSGTTRLLVEEDMP